MVRPNLWTEVGLVNSVMGKVRRIIFNGCRLPNLPDCTVMDFNKYFGATYKNKLAAITPVTKIFKDEFHCCLIQF